MRSMTPALTALVTLLLVGVSASAQVCNVPTDLDLKGRCTAVIQEQFCPGRAVAPGR